MELSKLIAKRFEKSACHFFQEGTCILHRKWCGLCDRNIETIEGLTATKDYLEIVNQRKMNGFTAIMAFASLLVSILALFVSVLKLFQGK
jgi:hypothetical protein